MTFYWKVVTHDWRSPLRGGPPLSDGTLPYDMPMVALDTSARECAPGWHCSRRAAAALKIAGMWPDGWPARLLVVEPTPDVVHRDEKSRSSGQRWIRGATQEEWLAAVTELSKPFGLYQSEMVYEQNAWYTALGRPQHNEAQVEKHLRETLVTRGLTWELKQFVDAWAARAAWAAWDARAALVLYFAAKMGWESAAPTLLTRGLRDAYRLGLDTALPVAPAVLGWTMTAP